MKALKLYEELKQLVDEGKITKDTKVKQQVNII